jgi:hypothetical protein
VLGAVILGASPIMIAFTITLSINYIVVVRGRQMSTLGIWDRRVGRPQPATLPCYLTLRWIPPGIGATCWRWTLRYVWGMTREAIPSLLLVFVITMDVMAGQCL